MKAVLTIAVAATLFAALAAEAQPARQQQRSPPQPPAVIIERDRTPPPAPPERPVNPPRTFQDISPPMQSPTPLAPMAPRVGG